MKKVLILISTIILGFLSINSSYAANTSSWYIIWSDVNIYTIYKQTILSRHQVILDFKDWKQLNRKIEKYFINLYFVNNRTEKLETLEKNIWNILKKLEAKKPLTISEKKVFNLAKNLYLRTILELRKNVK